MTPQEFVAKWRSRRRSRNEPPSRSTSSTLKPLDNIKQMDAILAFDADEKPVEPAWPEAKVIIGNPPFLGGAMIRGQLHDRYTDTLFDLYGDRLPNFSDLVCYRFEKARAYIERGTVKRAGLLATNPIRGGTNRTALDRIKQSGDIFCPSVPRPDRTAGGGGALGGTCQGEPVQPHKEH